MAQKLDAQALGRYAFLGIGAVAVPVIAGKITQISGLLSNQIFAAGFQGITVGAALLAGIGIWAVEQLAYSK